MEVPRKTINVSLPIPLIEAGRAKARSRYMTFSGYLASLLEADQKEDEGLRKARKSSPAK
jgi:hypothetical protein